MGAAAKPFCNMRTVEGSRRRAAAVVSIATTFLIMGSGFSAVAQELPGLGGSSDEPTTTTAPPATTTTTAAPATTTTTAPRLLAPPPQQPQPSPSTTTTAPPPPPAQEADGDTTGRGQMPAELRALMNSVRRTPANNTRALLAALAPLEQYGLDATQRAVVGFGRFPVAGEAVWSDDWWFPRFGPGWRLHQGLDIFAPHGTPVRAPVDGRIRITNGGLGGLSVYVVQPDGTYWYLTHLAGVPEGIAEGVTVKTGQVVGFVGTSGNARGGQPHLHIQIHPRGGGPIPPKPVMDTFVRDALALAPRLLDAYAKAYAQQGAAPAVAPPTVEIPEPELVTLTPRKALLWASAASPAGGTLRLVENDALAAAGLVDWEAQERAFARRAAAAERARLALLPLVPQRFSVALGMR